MTLNKIVTSIMQGSKNIYKLEICRSDMHASEPTFRNWY